MKNKININTDITQIHDGFFYKILKTENDARDFMEQVLPDGLKAHLDLAHIKIENTKYISNEFKKGFSDIVVKTRLRSKKDKKIPVDIFFLAEHKSHGRIELMIQFLKYMVFEWEKDYNNNRPPRIIIPVVFYHGAEEWEVAREFVAQFDVDDEIKRYMLNFRYILFDTNPWDFRDESNKKLKENVFLFSAMVLMKAAYKNDTEAIREIFRFWHEKGFTENTEIVLYFMTYIFHTQDIDRDQLKKMLDDSKIEGGEIMPTLAQRMKEEFREEFMHDLGPQLRKERNEAKKEEKIATAKQMLRRGFDIETIMEITGLEKSEIETLAPGATAH